MLHEMYDIDNKHFFVRVSTLDRHFVKEEQQLLKYIHLDTSDRWLDVYAHIGAFAICIANQVKSIAMFEPESDNFILLQKNILLNSIKNTKQLQCALVANDDKKRLLYIKERPNRFQHTLINPWKTSSVEVECANITRVIQNYHINKIKMDCEGSEAELIPAIIPVIKQIKEFIFEYHADILNVNEYNNIIAMLKTYFKIEEFKNIVHCTK